MPTNPAPFAAAPSPSSAQPSRGGRLFLAVLIPFALLYILTTQHGPAWQDAGVFQWRTVNFDLTGWLGLALAHPLLIVLGRAFEYLPFGDVAWRINILSALCGALAVASVALLVRRLTPRTPMAAWFAAGVFGLAHTTWWLSTIDQDQALHVLLFTLQLLAVAAMVDRKQPFMAALLGLASGLAFSVHDLALLPLPGYAVLVLCLCLRKQLPWTAVPLMIVGWLAGSGLYLWLIAREAMAVGIPDAIRSALFGRGWQHAVTGAPPIRTVALGFGYVLYNLPSAALPLAVLGVWSSKKQCAAPLRWTLLYVGAIYFAFAVRYDIVTQFMFFLPFYAVAVVLAGLGLAHLTQGPNPRRWLTALCVASLAAGPILYAAAPALCRACHVPLPSRSDLPFRDPARYLLTPWKSTEDSALRFARAALTETRDGDTLIADSTAIPALQWVQRFEPLGQGVRILNIWDSTPQGLPQGNPRVFLVSKVAPYYPPWMTDHVAEFEKASPDAVLYHVRWLATSQPTSAD